MFSLEELHPLDGIGPDQLNIDPLLNRIRTGNVAEVIMATNPNVEGDGTALYISNLLSEYPIEITRLARGVTSGSVLEYTNKEILADALSGRQNGRAILMDYAIVDLSISIKNRFKRDLNCYRTDGVLDLHRHIYESAGKRLDGSFQPLLVSLASNKHRMRDSKANQICLTANRNLDGFSF